MDNDKQVTDLTQGTRDRFLNQPLRSDSAGRKGFDLEGEFAKSAKNRSLLMPIVVGVFLVILGVGAWIASQFTDQASQKSTVTIGSFEDLKLKEIFDTARRNKEDLAAVQGQIDQLLQASAVRVGTIQQSANSQAEIATVNDPSGAKAKAILAEAAQKVRAERASLAVALAPLKAQADAIQKKIDSYDDRIGQLNKKNQQVLDSQQRLFDLEKGKIVQDYEARLKDQSAATAATVARLKDQRDALVDALKARHAEEIRQLILKYNPIFTDPALAAELQDKGAKAAAYPGPALPDQIGSQNLIPVDLQMSLASRVQHTRELLSRLKDIPYENSVPLLLNALDNAIADSLAGYDAYLAPLAAHMTTQDATIDQLKNDLAASTAKANTLEAKQGNLALWVDRWKLPVEQYVSTLRDWDGVLTDLRDPSDWLAILRVDRGRALATALAAKPSAGLASVRDGLNNNELGTVTLEQAADGSWRARLVHLYDQSRPFKPFDRVVLSLPR